MSILEPKLIDFETLGTRQLDVIPSDLAPVLCASDRHLAVACISMHTIYARCARKSPWTESQRDMGLGSVIPSRVAIIGTRHSGS